MNGTVRQRRGGFTLVLVLLLLLFIAGLVGWLFFRSVPAAPAPAAADEKPAPVERPSDREKPR